MSRTLLASLGLAALCIPVLAGCSSDKIETYEVPYHKQRLLGAIVRTDDNTWFFKLMGDGDDVAANRDAFRGFVRSLQFRADASEPVSWKLPDKWTYEAGSGLRFGTLYIPRSQVVTGKSRFLSICIASAM